MPPPEELLMKVNLSLGIDYTALDYLADCRGWSNHNRKPRKYRKMYFWRYGKTEGQLIEINLFTPYFIKLLRIAYMTFFKKWAGIKIKNLSSLYSQPPMAMTLLLARSSRVSDNEIVVSIIRSIAIS